MGRRRHQRRAHHRERGEAAEGGRSAGALALARCARSRSSRRLQESARRLAEHGGGSADPQQDRAPLHRADDRGLAQSRRARSDRRLRARSPRAPRCGTSTSWCRRVAGSSCRTSPPRSTTRCSPRSTGSRRSTTGRMLVNAKCAPHYIKTVLENGGSQIRTYSGGAGGCPAGTHYMGIRPNGDVTPCPYLPVFAGTLRNSSLADLWTSSELFTGIRQRTSLGGRCGECEMNGHCGGCRARAYGMSGDVMAEDPLCTHVPGKFTGAPLLTLRGPATISGRRRRSNTAPNRRRPSPGTMRPPSA